MSNERDRALADWIVRNVYDTAGWTAEQLLDPIGRILAPERAERDALKAENERLRVALVVLVDAVEHEAARQTVKTGMGASEWRAFVSQAELLAINKANAALTPDEKGGE